MKRISLCFLAAVFLLSGCGKVEPHANTTESTVNSEIPENTEEVEEAVDVLSVMMLSVTDGGLPTDRESVFARMEDLASVGVTCVRIDTSWDTTEKGVWKMSDATKNYLDAAKEYGLKLKLILPTVMAPPAWLAEDINTRLVDQNGRLSVNTVSYWYDGVCTYSRQALTAQLTAIKDGGWGDTVAAIVADMGPAGEPLYPPEWTQVASGLDGGAGEDQMWCYGENAKADFKDEMKKKYGNISDANAAWNTEFSSFEEIFVPCPGDVKGKYWEDTLEWYYLTKREFMTSQVDVFKTVMSDLGFENAALILYLPGADVTQKQWESCIQGGSAVSGIRLACDNRFTAELAAEKGCVLQYTGINDVYRLGLLRMDMYENGLYHVPVFGENAGDALSAADIAGLGETVKLLGLYGLDYTHSRWLYEADGITRNEKFSEFVDTVNSLKEWFAEVDRSQPPKFFSEILGTAAPSGNVLRLDIEFDKPEDESLAYVFVKIASSSFVIQNGDKLEYDVMISEPMQGLGAVDGNLRGGKTLRDSFGINDSLGIRAHPNADLSDFAYQRWHHRVLNIGNEASDGARFTDISVAAHPENSDGAFTQKSVTVFYDNIVITRNGEVVAEIFTDGDGFVVRPATASMFASCNITVEPLN